MARIKFVLWERYRAWWGAHELNQEDPLLVDKIQAEVKLRRKEGIEKRLANMPPEELKERRKTMRKKFEKRAARRERRLQAEAELSEKEAMEVADFQRLAAAKESESEREARELAEFQRLAAGGLPETKPPV